MTSPVRLAVELLEDRLTPATSGITWPDGSHLTLSFVPDGTLVGDAPSNLFAHMSPAGSTAAWQQAILRAFQAWATPANLNVGVVPDGGQPLGTTGIVQGDSRFGDIRIAALPLASGTLMTNTQFQWSGTTWSGDVVVNSTYLFSLGGGPNTYDLFTSMLNEAGNIFGVLDSRADTASGVYYEYTGPKTGIDANDVADIHSLYGTRAPDQYDAAATNNTKPTATNLGLALTPFSLRADLTTASDVDWYKFSVPVLTPGVVGLTVHLGTSGVSALTGTVQVYNALGQLVGSASAPDALHGNMDVTVSGGGILGGLLGGLEYFVKVSSNTAIPNNPFAVGAYNLSTTYSLSNGNILGPILGTVGGLLDLESGLNDTLNAALQLPSRLVNGQKPDARFDYAYKASISTSSDVDYYKVVAPTGSGQKMNVLVWALEPNRLLPRVDVYNSAGTLVPSTLLANENGTFSVEVPGVTSGGTYYVKVSALAPGGSHNTGNYFLGVDFTTQPVTTLTGFGSGTLTASQPQAWSKLAVSQNQLYEFILAANAPSGTELRYDIFDAAGNDIFTLRAYGGVPASTGHIYLRAGTYTVRYMAIAPSGTALPTTSFTLTGRMISDPIGPQKDTGTTPTGPTDSTTINHTPPGYDQPYYA
jgi:hypothetical protein